jgi:hypothetical protein
MLHLGQVEVGSETSLDGLKGIVEKVETEIKHRSRHGFPVDDDSGLVEMPTSGSNEEDGRLFVELVGLSIGSVINLASDSVIQVELAVDHV